MKTSRRARLLTVLALVGAAAAFTFSHASTQSQPLPGGGPSPDEAALRAAGVDGDWWSQALARIQALEYEASVSDQGLQAPNRAQDLRTRFGPAAITIVPRRQAEPCWQWSWQTLAWGREGDRRIAGEAQLSGAGNRVTYTRPGLVEWYENRAEGLEQGFTVLERPAGEGELVIEGALSSPTVDWGRAIPRMELDGQTLSLTDRQGVPVLQITELAALDASGARLPARMEVEGNAARIWVDDGEAFYPITIDPLWLNPRSRGWTLDPWQYSGMFGFCVSTAGDVNGDGFDDVLVGSIWYDGGQEDEGAAFLYLGSPSGPPGTPNWSAESNQAEAQLGYCVATAGDVNGDGYDDVIVGAPYYDNGQFHEGTAYAWHGSANGMGPNGTPNNADWACEVSQTSALFGLSVATAGDVNGDGYDDAIVGAPFHDDWHVDEGTAWLFLGGPNGLPYVAAWHVRGNQMCAYLGTSVATAGDVNGDGYDDVVIGTPEYDEVFLTNEGAAYVWHGCATGLQPSSTPADADWSYTMGQAHAKLGSWVASAGDVNGDGYGDVIIGAPYYDDPEVDEGWAGVFAGSHEGLPTAPTWSFECNQADARMGVVVATAGDFNGDGYADVLAGASHYEGPDSPTDAGAVFLYSGSEDGPGSDPAIMLGDWASGRFGWSAGTAGDVDGDGFSDIIVGAFLHGGETGTVEIYPGTGNAPEYFGAGSWTLEPNLANMQFGFSVAAAGDMTGEGYGDIIVGAPGYDGGEAEEGAIFIYPGTYEGPNSLHMCIGKGRQADAHLGSSVAGAGDINGDGYDDVVVGAPDYDVSRTDEGLVIVIYGSASGPPNYVDPSVAEWSARGAQTGAYLGQMAAGAGDVNGDGCADLLAGAHAFDHGTTNEGAVFLWEGSPEGLGDSGTPGNADWMAESNMASALLGASGGTAGDVNGDGYSDIVAGAYNTSNGETSEGRVYAWYGGPEGLGDTGSPENADWMVESNHAYARFGYAVSTAGDVNGDGYSDVVVGAYSYDDGAESGGVYCFGGSATGLETTASWEKHYPGANSAFGYAVAAAGDVDGDGFGDVIVGVKLGESDGYADEGLAYLYGGSQAGLAPNAGWIGAGGQTNCFYGAAVAGAGDVNGDGFDDVMVGAPRWDHGQTDEGQVFLYFGNHFLQADDGRERLPRQMRSDGSAPIARLGISDAETSFRLSLQGRTPAGRGKVRLQWEVKPLGVPFDGAGLVEGAVDQDTGAPSGTDGSYVELDELVTGLEADTVYRWRMRILTDSPFFSHSRWFWMQGNDLTQWCLRTAEASSEVTPGVVALSGRLSLSPAFPNPFQTFTSLSLELVGSSRAQVTVHDLAGRKVAGLWDGGLDAERRTMLWNGNDDEGRPLPEGVYFIRAEVDGQTLSRRVTRVR